MGIQVKGGTWLLAVQRQLGSTAARLVTGYEWAIPVGAQLMGKSCDPMMSQPYLQVQVVVLGMR